MKHIAKSWILSLGMYEPGRPIDEVARELGFKNTDEIIKLASNENALGPSPLAIETMKQLAPEMHLYPDAGAHHLRKALARQLGVSPGQIIVANGSNEIIEFIGHLFLESGVEMIMADRGFAIFNLIGLMFQATVKLVPMRDYTHDLEAMLSAITPRTRVVFVANPNNPTGTMLNADAVDAFIKAVPDHVVVCMDEAYLELLPENRRPNSIKHIKDGRHVIVLRTFSKTYGLAGLRVGYAVASEEAVALMARVRQPFTVNAMGLAAAAAALEDHEHVSRTQNLVRDGLSFFEARLPAMGLPFVPAVANFMLVKVGNGREVFKELQHEKVIVRPMDGYNLPDHVRVTIGTLEQNELCLQALARCMARRKLRAAGKNPK